ncbi:unnamed protein product [Prunus armeniaca]|uniref:Uncharacterized protein n=1 Tax=Prunus armeniaca TaxID=36596 RepID=A0A6J5V1J7_PRUAR|nr:unnamed protein product [Prunus armeniaca]CAB4312383.1 unnamed protein product [Prunus armeniaca]
MTISSRNVTPLVYLWVESHPKYDTATSLKQFASVLIDGVTYKPETGMYPSKLITKVIFVEKDKEEES